MSRAEGRPAASPGRFWDERFAAEEYRYGTRPNRFLVDQAWRLPPRARVLVVGDGEGRNGVWLARQGCRVMSVDASARGLQKAAKLALDQGVSLRTACADLRDWAWPSEAYDAVVAIFLHFAPDDRAAMHRAMAAALVPGGLLLLQGFTPQQIGYGTGGPPDPAMMFTADALREDFAGLEIEHLAEYEDELAEGSGHSGRAALVGLVARRPAQ